MNSARSILTVKWQQAGEPMCYSTDEVALVPRVGEPFRIMEREAGELRCLVAGVVRNIAWVYSVDDEALIGRDIYNCCVTLAAHPTHTTENVDASCGGCGKPLPTEDLSFDRDGGDPLCITCLPLQTGRTIWRSK